MSVPDQKLLPPPKKRCGRMVFWLILSIVAIGGLIWFIHSHTASDAAPKKGKDGAAVPVVLATAVKGDIDVTEREIGTVTPLANITVRTQINGILQEVAFQEGQIVQQGDFLAQIDPRPYQTQLEQAEGAIQRDKALLAEAQLNLERYQKLVRQDSVAVQQVDTQASLVGQYQGDIVTDQGQIDAAKLDLVYCHIVAPVTGRVGLRQVDAGNYVQTGDTNGLVVLTQLQPISVLFTLPEDDIPQVMQRLDTGAELQTTAFDRTQATQLAVGKLQAVDTQIDTSTGTVKIRADFDNKDGKLYPNQFVNIDLLVDMLKDAVTVPTAAIQRGSPGTFVYLVSPDGQTVAIKVVKLGPTQGETIAVLDGLSAGDKVVVEGADKLKDGAKITLPNAPDGSDPNAKAGDTKNGGKDGNDNGQHQHHKKAAE